MDVLKIVLFIWVATSIPFLLYHANHVDQHISKRARMSLFYFLFAAVPWALGWPYTYFRHKRNA